MKPKKRQKLCHNCEGEIDIEVIVCPFCAADLREEKPEQGYSSSYVSQTHQMREKQTMQSLYPPLEKEIEEVGESVLEEKTDPGVVAPTVLFTVGVQLFIFSLLMLLFSHNGVVVLKWDARFWFFYAFASVPFLVFGYKALSRL